MAAPPDASATSPLPVRLALNAEILRDTDYWNTRQIATYKLACDNWRANQGRGFDSPPPEPPKKMLTRPKENRADYEIDFDQRWNLPPVLEQYFGDIPVCEKCKPSAPPTAQGPVIGTRQWNTNWFSAAYVDEASRMEVTDHTPGGTEVEATSRDGVHGRFKKHAFFVGGGHWELLQELP